MYSKTIKKTEDDIQNALKRVNELAGRISSSSSHIVLGCLS